MSWLPEAGSGLRYRLRRVAASPGRPQLAGFEAGLCAERPPTRRSRRRGHRLGPGPRRLVARRLAYRTPGHRSGSIRFLSDGRLLVLREGSAELYDRGDLRSAIVVPMRSDTRWCVSRDDRYLDVAIRQGLCRTDLNSGRSPVYRAPITRPERMPPADLALGAGVRAGCYLWRTEQGAFLHQGDGPRGWVQPLSLSPTGRVVVPAEEGAANLPADAGRVPRRHPALRGEDARGPRPRRRRRARQRDGPSVPVEAPSTP